MYQIDRNLSLTLSDCQGNANTYSADGIENGYNHITIFGECLSMSNKL